MPETEPVEHWRRVEEIFHLALEIPEDVRSEFVSACCAGDVSLETDLREILAGYEAQERLGLRTDAAAHTRFGAFEAVKKIGEGGMGVVYLGRRLEDFDQLAAIKVIHGSPAGKALIAERFRKERQILAGLEHPNIARLLDGGVSRAGQSYLAMEYVEGVPLDRYCAERKLTTEQRLRLFLKICAAVHFAHQHLIIHRDLKPGNILVTESGEPKLLDFGIAKVFEEPGTDPTATITAGLIMTPRYASPEQIRGLPCTLATDIYSLGVILFELLTGRSPYSATTSTALIAAVMTEEVPRPSTMAAEGMKRSLRGDLDGIVGKAMAKRPEDRYGSVEQLSEDLRRYLKGHPVSAVEGTRLYIAHKFVVRHRAGVAAAGLILLTLIGGLAATLWQARAAERERTLAEQRFSEARKLANYLLFPLYDAVQTLPGSLPVRAEMASQSLLYLDRLGAAKSKDRALQLELGEGYVRLGTILEAPVGSGDNLGETSEALEVDQKALAILEPLNAEKPNDPEVQRYLGRAHKLLGNVWNLRGKSEEGIAELNQSIVILDRMTASNPRDSEGLIDAGLAYVALGDVISGKGGGYVQMTSRDQVISAADKAVARFQSALAISGAEDRAALGIAQAQNLKGNVLVSQDVSLGLPTLKQGLESLYRLSPATRLTPASQALEARLLTVIGFCEEESGRYEEAVATLVPAQQILDRRAELDPKNATNALRRVNLYRIRGMANQYAGHLKDAIADFRKTIEILDVMISVDPAKQSNRVTRAESQGRLSGMLAKDGQTAEAERVLKTAFAFFAEIAGRPDASLPSLKEAASAFINSPIERMNDYRRALGYAQRADALAQGKDHTALFYMAECYEMLRDGPKALDAIQRDFKLLPPTPPGETPSRNRVLAEKHLRIIQELIRTGKLPE